MSTADIYSVICPAERETARKLEQEIRALLKPTDCSTFDGRVLASIQSAALTKVLCDLVVATEMPKPFFMIGCRVGFDLSTKAARPVAHG